ncbi:MAG: ferrochelatase, partial [Alphaproteobacteria bacterium]
LARPKLMEALKVGRPRLLCSAHGLPKRVVSRGDPYQWQVERTAETVARILGLDREDWVVCYQSRVGPLEWIGPATDEEIVRAGRDGVPVVVLPIAFVSEHSETLVELDMEYGDLARRHHVPGYFRVPTVQTAPAFIEGLARLVISAPRAARQPASETGSRICDLDWTGCVCVGDGGC